MNCKEDSTVRLDGRKQAQDQKPASPGGILEKIAGRGHCTISMQPRSAPCDYRPEELAEIVANCQVTYSGFAYPHPGDGPYGTARTTPSYTEACHDAFGRTSVWRFYCDGRFKERTALAEDASPAPHRASFRMPDGPLPRYLEPVWTLYTMSETFAFASDLATDTEREYAVSVSLDGMGGRVLRMLGEGRIEFFREYASRDGRIELGPAPVVPGLDTDLCGRIALDKTLEIMDRFGWRGSSPRDMLEHDQELFYANVRRT